MLGNSHVRFGVGAGVKSPGPHHADCTVRQLRSVLTTEASNGLRGSTPGR
jgi:hypothetical protein